MSKDLIDRNELLNTSWETTDIDGSPISVVSVNDINAVPSLGTISHSMFAVFLTEDEINKVAAALDVMGDRIADRDGYSSGEEYWDLKDKLFSCITEHKSNQRFEALRNYKENEELMQRVAEEQKQSETKALISQIKTLEPRIKEIIAVGNACLQSNIPLTGQAFGMREDYDTNQFFTNSWSHLVGFAGNPHKKPCHIEFLGINGGGACGAYDFRTDGNKVFAINERNPADIIPASIGHMKRFLERFETFESAFYAYVDKTIEKQQKSVDKLITSAQEKAANQKSSLSRDLHGLDR